MRTLAIDRSLFVMVFGLDVDYHDWPPRRFRLDQSTGEVIWFYECDEDAYMEAGMPEDENREERERVEAEPGRFLEIPGLDHGEHHAILRDFPGGAVRRRAVSGRMRRIRARSADG